MRVGILANEFLDPRINRVGGFGWAARRAADILAAAGHVPVFLTGEVAGIEEVGGHQLIPRQSTPICLARRMRRARLELILSVDYRPAYLPVLLAAPRLPLILWVRDPHDAAIDARIAQLSGSGYAEPPRLIGTRGAGRLIGAARGLGRRIVLASPAPAMLGPRAAGAYGLPSAPTELRLLPNPVAAVAEAPSRAPGPRVLALNRLEAVKRPWVVAEVARRLPRVEFVMAGQAYSDGPTAWRPDALPDNLHLVGNVSGSAKGELLASGWLLVNAAIHEGLPISFLEALAHAIPLVAEVEADGTTERFGIRTPPTPGDGLEGVEALAAGVRTLLDDGERRERLGRAGREWVRATHSPEAFLRAFEGLAAGV